MATHDGSAPIAPIDSAATMESGSVWIVDAYGCDELLLRSTAALERVFAEIVLDLGLHPVREIVWQRFPAPGGVTGFQVLAESHVSCHTFPEHRFAAFDLYCCKPRPDWPWSARLLELIGAERVNVRRLERGGELATVSERGNPLAIGSKRRRERMTASERALERSRRGSTE
jgi:S-adenosylmethionine decarboxylase